MLVGANTFALSVLVGIIIGCVNAYFRYRETRSFRAMLQTFAGWLLAFTITGFIATPIAQWLLHTVF